MDPLSTLSAALAGRYDVDREIGAGGMATVYIARDLRHDRRVALKVLRPELGAVLGVERFLAEIRVTANLQHPNLLPLFDSGEANGLLFYVMPFVEGENLRARLDRERQLPVDEAVRIAVGVASALHYAHQHGIIHRDLKPENILLQAGQPVVADFGIALAVTNAGGTRVTQTGLSLGTPQYMSPEQATGDHAIDGRTDIYSLGALTYEMLTGEPPHTGHSVQAIIARVLTDKPRPVRLIRDTVPPHVEAAIDKALAKLPADRFATPNEFADALQGRVMLAGPSAPVAAAPATKAAGGARSPAAWIRSPLPWAAAFLVSAALAAWGWFARPGTDPPPQLPVRLTLSLPAGARIARGAPLPLTIAPDGRTVVYGADAAGGRQLFTRAMDELEVRPVSGTANAYAPRVSPDGRWILWVGGNKVRKTPIDGGQWIDVAEFALPEASADWLSNDELVLPATPLSLGVAQSARGGISVLARVSASGGQLRPFTRLDSTSREGNQLRPLAVREEGIVLFTSFRLGFLAGRLGVARIATGESKIFDVPMDYAVGYAAGHVIYMRDAGVLAAVPLDTRRLEIRGPSIPLMQGLRQDLTAMSASGSLVYALGGGLSEVVSVDERGASTPLLAEKGRFAHPRLSPDGRRLALDLAGSSMTDIWTYDVASGTPTRLTTANDNDRPEWTPDGTKLLYLSTRGAADYNVWWQSADGSAAPEELLHGTNPVREAVLARDGKALIYREDHPDSLRDILLVATDKKDAPVPLVASRFDELMPRVSPDGKWLAYQSNESGQYEIYVRPFPAGTARTTVSNAGGTEPLWSADGQRLFYRHGTELVAVTFAAGTGFAVMSRRVLFAGNYELHPFHPNYDVTPDGKRFIMIKPGSEEIQLVVVVNWVEELRRRLGAGR